jgi:hypothetical protein
MVPWRASDDPPGRLCLCTEIKVFQFRVLFCSTPKVLVVDQVTQLLLC